MKEFIEVPFGAKDSELGGWEYNIPEGMEATIVDNKIVVKKKENEDDKIRKELYDFCIKCSCGETIVNQREEFQRWAAWLEKQDTKVSVYRDTLFKIATILSQYEDKDDSPLEKIRSIMIDGTICSMDLESKNKKQGEQKPTDEEMKILLQTEYEKGKADAIEQKSAWSEEDEKIYGRIYDIVHSAAYSNYEVDEDGEECGEYAKMVKLLKFLKERYIWKPSDEQIEVLVWCKPLFADPKSKGILESLINDLKKLREE